MKFHLKGRHESGMSVITEKGHNSTSLAKLIVLRTETPARKDLGSFSENQTSLSLKTKPWRGRNTKTDRQPESIPLCNRDDIISMGITSNHCR